MYVGPANEAPQHFATDAMNGATQRRSSARCRPASASRRGAPDQRVQIEQVSSRFWT